MTLSATELCAIKLIVQPYLIHTFITQRFCIRLDAIALKEIRNIPNVTKENRLSIL